MKRQSLPELPRHPHTSLDLINDEGDVKLKQNQDSHADRTFDRCIVRA